MAITVNGASVRRSVTVFYTITPCQVTKRTSKNHNNNDSPGSAENNLRFTSCQMASCTYHLPVRIGIRKNIENIQSNPQPNGDLVGFYNETSRRDLATISEKLTVSSPKRSQSYHSGEMIIHTDAFNLASVVEAYPIQGRPACLDHLRNDSLNGKSTTRRRRPDRSRLRTVPVTLQEIQEAEEAEEQPAVRDAASISIDNSALDDVRISPNNTRRSLTRAKACLHRSNSLPCRRTCDFSVHLSTIPEEDPRLRQV